ncbi:hypothetical protein L914_12386 [Phytophthora nicotianae]|uniref:Uncharacterized protein n=3 Tax=Phytophthora nicotianae TaxID=4792 RepID=V9EU03_PHYNI|nr:hypothetical protein F443_12848 [Phytophthora nicotianae P1569]ETL35397.1 hypothetical protein L916_12469 [Phytophthora nicotianae]ETM41879.1 hypothetical protein L914_12386 [Phytophthora nicotianae]ETO70583.1 hypothetical protein F444_12954 [Phytophthora nicotianae P1976]
MTATEWRRWHQSSVAKRILQSCDKDSYPFVLHLTGLLHILDSRFQTCSTFRVGGLESALSVGHINCQHHTASAAAIHLFRTHLLASQSVACLHASSASNTNG